MNLGLELVKVLVYPGLLFIIILSLIVEWIDRKIYAKAQNRIGPYHIGPKGFLQPFADLIKLLTKEDITPPHVDKLNYTIAPFTVLYLSIIGFYFIPTCAWGTSRAILAFEGDYLLVLTIFSLATLFTFLGGWGSYNRFGAIGSLRALLLVTGYEIPLFICSAAVVIDAGTLCLSKIVMVQQGFNWFIIKQPLGFALSLLACQAELERIPFDIPEAETEIVGGWLTEFSGRKLAFFRLATDIEVTLLAAFIVTLYLGGPLGPTGPSIIYFLIKLFFVVFLLSLLRSIFARFRIDQALTFFWKYIIPLSFLQIIIALAIR